MNAPHRYLTARRARHPQTARQRALALLTALCSLALAALACTANDTLFIRLTQTPTPTITPTPLALQTRLKVGDTVTVIGFSEFQSVNAADLPGPPVAGISNAACFPNTKVPVLDISLSLRDSADPVIYYQVRCSGRTGWLADYQLSRFVRNDAAVVQSGGEGAILHSAADQTTAGSARCADGTQVQVRGVALNTATRNLADDPHLYVQVDCDGQSGYVWEELLAPAS
jgi:hypothetical protein